jgi:DNA-binding NtrC family response regulator
LVTRNQVFSQAGFDVTSTMDAREATDLCQREHFDAAVLGDSIPVTARLQLAAILRYHCPDLPVVLMTRPGDECRGDGYYCINSLDGPAALIEMVERAIAESEEKAAS